MRGNLLPHPGFERRTDIYFSFIGAKLWYLSFRFLPQLPLNFLVRATYSVQLAQSPLISWPGSKHVAWLWKLWTIAFPVNRVGPFDLIVSNKFYSWARFVRQINVSWRTVTRTWNIVCQKIAAGFKEKLLTGLARHSMKEEKAVRLSISQIQTRRGAKEVKIRSTSYERERVPVMLWVISSTILYSHSKND